MCMWKALFLKLGSFEMDLLVSEYLIINNEQHQCSKFDADYFGNETWTVSNKQLGKQWIFSFRSWPLGFNDEKYL